MSFPSGPSSRWLVTPTAVLLSAALVLSASAADADTDTTHSALVTLINRLSERGVLSKADSSDLILLAEADAAEARAQKAQAEAVLARAMAMEARARAMAAMSGNRPVAAGPANTLPDRASAVAEENRRAVAVATEQMRRAPVSRSAPTEEEYAAAVARAEHVARTETPARSRQAVAEESEPAPQPARTRARAQAAEEEQEAAPSHTRKVSHRSAPADEPSETVAEAAPMRKAKPTQAVAEETVPADAASATDDTVRVTYVPEVVKQRLREEIKQDVLDEARQEGWATPHAVPDWVSRLRLFGDIRFRAEGLRYPPGNDDTGAFPNYNAVNTGAPWDMSNYLPGNSGLPFPQLNVNADRNRLRLRARLGSAIDLGENFSAGLRFATGENNSPVSQNQSLGAAGSGLGGNFSKYALWLDRGFLKYELGGLPDEDLAFNFGRFDNPFQSTSILWADDIGFDGLDAQGRYGLGEDITGFFTAGAFPVFNTDLNFATNNYVKFKSNDKWLYAAQLGASFELGKDFTAKISGAYYWFTNISGRLSSPFTPTTTSDAGDTDARRPSFAQKGNTYMELRNIVNNANNNYGNKYLYQYFGLASKFQPVAVDARLEFNHFQPLQIVLSGEYVRNIAFNQLTIADKAVNNRSGVTPAGQTLAPFVGGNNAWIGALTVGNTALQKRWDWNVSLGYRKVGSDALIDGFADSDFGGGGTNVKGTTFSANLALSSRVWVGARWMSATAVAGPVFKNDIIQLDLNGKF